MLWLSSQLRFYSAGFSERLASGMRFGSRKRLLRSFPLSFTARQYSQVEEYLKNGWNPNESTKSVYYAIKYNPDSNKEKDEWKMLELLLKNGAKTDVQISENPKGVNTPLTYTTECGYYGATKLLLEYGADCNYQENYMNQNGLLALRFYENNNAAKTLQLLLDYGTDLDVKQIDNKTGREKLKNFQNDYINIKDKVPNYDEIVNIIDGLGL